MFVASTLALTALFLAVAIGAWGPWREFFANPARTGVVAASLAMAVVACFSDANLSSGRREDTASRWIFVPFAIYAVLLTWLPPYCDRRDILTLDGEAVRCAGLAVFVVGGVLRIAPMFILGARFSALVAIQEQHELVTGGLYRTIRHPSFLGAGLITVGWCLVFRSALGLLLMPIVIWIGVARMNAEEALLAAEFGERYAAYRRRTWRIIPWVY